MRTRGYIAACLTNGEYVQLGPVRSKLQAYELGIASLPVFEIVFVDRRGQRVIAPYLNGNKRLMQYR